MALVLDASVLVAACLSETVWEPFGEQTLMSPALALSETCSALHEAQWRQEIQAETARLALDRLAAAPVDFVYDLPLEPVWQLADRLGWAKTYDAEYVALADREGCGLVTLDRRLKRAAGSLVPIVHPDEL